MGAPRSLDRAAHPRPRSSCGHNGRTRPVPLIVGWVVGLALLLGMSTSAWAHKNGIASSCDGCHSGGTAPTVTLTSDTSPVELGQTIVLTVMISNTNGPVAGFFVQSSGPGTFSLVDTPGTQLMGGGVTHTMPRAGVNGFTTFRVGWTAPAAEGGVDFTAWGLSANGDGTPSGDAGSSAFLSVAYGCGAGTKYYTDNDQDGYAQSTGYTVNCSQPKYYSTVMGDCDDNDPAIHPGAMEVCNGKDDNCNTLIDEGLPTSTYCTDSDGDGHGVAAGPKVTACRPSQGFGLCDSDCNDKDPTIYPGATEVCNFRDDNCNNMIDEDLAHSCGVGWCFRYGSICSGSCTPGQPAREVCDGIDEDCDGVVDNGTNLELCGQPGLVCTRSVCVPSGDVGEAGLPPGDDAAAVNPSDPPPVEPSADGGVARASEPPNDGKPGCNVVHDSAAPSFGLSAALSLSLASVLRRARRARGNRAAAH